MTHSQKLIVYTLIGSLCSTQPFLGEASTATNGETVQTLTSKPPSALSTHKQKQQSKHKHSPHNKYPPTPYPEIGKTIVTTNDCDGSNSSACSGVDQLAEQVKQGESSINKQENISDQQPFTSDCPLTPEIWELSPIDTEYTSNDLRRMAGSAYFAEGSAITIMGRILDGNCIPVTGAKVKMAQVDSFGHNRAEKGHDPYFAGAGTATTDNLGRFSFFSVMPGPLGKRAPHVRLSVQHPELQQFETEMFFPDNFANKQDPVLKTQVKPALRELLVAKHFGYDTKNKVDLYEFNITLGTTLNYKTY